MLGCNAQPEQKVAAADGDTLRPTRNTPTVGETFSRTAQNEIREPLSKGQASRIRCTVSRVADGDSIYCGSTGRIRLLMIDAPELAQGEVGRLSRDALDQLLPRGTAVTIETDVRARDRFDRILGYVFLADGRMVNEEMARGGFVTALVIPPNVRHADRIRRVVNEARLDRRGLWATPAFACGPREYRDGRCPPARGDPTRSNRDAMRR